MKTVMVSGHFDPFHDVHLDYIKQAMTHGDFLICVVSSDGQLIQKKGSFNIPESGRLDIVHLILRGLDIPHKAVVNQWDKATTLIAKALEFWQPDVLFRGNDKTLETMPAEERKVCDELQIQIVHAVLDRERHGSEMIL